MNARLDPDRIAEVKARTSLVELIGKDVDLKQRGRDHWGLCPLHGEKTPSFKVDGGDASWKCFGCGEHGDAVDYLQKAHGMGFLNAVEHLAAAAGLEPDRDGRTEPEKKSIRRPPPNDAAEREGRIEWAREWWAKCQPDHPLLRAYLEGRGIKGEPPPTLRFHGALKHTDTGLYLPAMVAAIQDPAGRIVGVHRTYLAMDGTKKAVVASPKKIAGRKVGCAIRLAAAGPVMVCGEGIETTLSVMQATGLPGWAAIDLGNMAGGGLGRGAPHPDRLGKFLPSERPDPDRPGLLPPPGCREWILLKDNDSKDPHAADALMERAKRKVAATGVTVREAVPPEGMDFNDLLAQRGGAEVLEQFR